MYANDDFSTPKGCDDCRKHGVVMNIERRRRDIFWEERPYVTPSGFLCHDDGFFRYKHDTPSELKPSLRNINE